MNYKRLSEGLRRTVQKQEKEIENLKQLASGKIDMSQITEYNGGEYDVDVIEKILKKLRAEKVKSYKQFPQMIDSFRIDEMENYIKSLKGE